MAIVHVAIFEVVNAIDRRYESYLGRAARRIRPRRWTRRIAQAAHDTLVALFPSQTAHCDELLADDLATMPDGTRQDGTASRLAARAAAAILRATRQRRLEPRRAALRRRLLPGDEPGEWRQDPISRLPLALGAHWGTVRPFVIPSGRAVPRAAAAGADAARSTPPRTTRSSGSAATASRRRPSAPTIRRSPASTGPTTARRALCAPPRLYNQIADADRRRRWDRTWSSTARLLALVNVGDGGRRHRDLGVEVLLQVVAAGHRHPRGRSGHRADRHRRRQPADARRPDVQPARRAGQQPRRRRTSRRRSRRIRPATPASAARCSRSLRKFYGTRRHPVHVRLRRVERRDPSTTRASCGRSLPRSFTSLSQAEEENGQSRIYLGIHWSFDKTAGIAQGRRVADYVFTHAFRPL